MCGVCVAGWLVGLALVCAFVCVHVCVRVFVSWFVRVFLSWVEIVVQPLPSELLAMTHDRRGFGDETAPGGTP